MAALAIALLLVGVAGAVTRPAGAPAWAVPAAATAVDLAAGAAHPGQAHGALSSLSSPIAFLLAAVPLAVLLDRLGFFAAAASVLTRGGRGVGGLWVLAAAVTTVLNLDASVVLLTPLYVRIARTRGTDPLGLAVQPVICSWLASSALPVSNLTNLIVASDTGATTAQFVANLGLPSLAAVTVGWLCYRAGVAEPAPATAAGGRAMVAPPGSVLGAPGRPISGEERRALAVGGAVVVGVLVGFVAGRDIGVVEWQVALAGDVVLAVVLHDRRSLPWRSIPVGTALVAASLGVLATAAVAHLPVGQALGGSSVAGMARTFGVTALAANVINNLPALLVVVPAFHGRVSGGLWAALLGVNMGPALVVTGTLASLLWVDTLGRLDVPVRSLDVTRVGLRVGVPGMAAGLGTLLALHAAGVAG